MVRREARRVLNWDAQKIDFEPDGSLRDIYVLGTTIDDWKTVLALIHGTRCEPKLLRDQLPRTMPSDVESLFGTMENLLLFSVAGVELACHFFTVQEIEFDFLPNFLTEESLLQLLQFIVHIGRATGKQVIMTPENCPQNPIFRYDAEADELTWPGGNASGR